MGTHQPIRKTVAPEIPDKLYFRIGDVARLCEVPAYVLRFWETEFPQLKPNKGGTGQRLYRKRDVEMALRIKSLLYDQGYTIPGARQVFKIEAKAREAAVPFEAPAPVPVPSAASAPALVPVDGGAAAPNADRAKIESRLHALRAEMQSLLTMLGKPPAAQGGAEAPARAKPLRPRLVTPAPAAKPATKPEPARLRLAQRDLFGDGPDAAE
ncbi:MAG TPA: MerR family transcriptional regulator [Candidatus Aquilonibacter sp.]|nr:MerR family transcriptional regulator [Candidatus Aquilonibacter sp.]